MLQPGSVFLQDLRAIPLKCNHWGNSTPSLSVGCQEASCSAWWGPAPSCRTISRHTHTSSLFFLWIKPIHKHTWPLTSLCPFTESRWPNVLQYFSTSSLLPWEPLTLCLYRVELRLCSVSLFGCNSPFPSLAIIFSNKSLSLLSLNVFYLTLLLRFQSCSGSHSLRSFLRWKGFFKYAFTPCTSRSLHSLLECKSDVFLLSILRSLLEQGVSFVADRPRSEKQLGYLLMGSFTFFKPVSII